jgi:hypothetical protein
VLVEGGAPVDRGRDRHAGTAAAITLCFENGTRTTSPPSMAPSIGTSRERPNADVFTSNHCGANVSGSLGPRPRAAGAAWRASGSRRRGAVVTDDRTGISS